LGNVSSSSARVFLTNQGGAGTVAGLIPAGNEYVASTLLAAPVSGMNTAFSGLTLGPGNYFLTFQNLSGIVGWRGFGGPATVITGTGATYLSGAVLNADSFAPAGTVNSSRTNNFTVTGDLQSPEVPEPSTFALTLGAAALLYFKRRR